MERFKQFYKQSICAVRAQILLLVLLTVSIQMYGLGYTPTDGGLVVDLKPGDRILLSTIINGEEYFVCHYPGYTTGSYFNYTNWDSGNGNFLKLVPQDAGATEPSSVSIWSIDTALTRFKNGNNYALGGISYTMWSSTSYTLRTSDGWKYQGDLTNEKGNANACDVIFVAPTNRSTVTSFDPKKTLTTYCGRTDQDSEGRFNGEKGFGFLGHPYREVYMMVIPRQNEPIVYGNAALVGFNTTTSNYTYHQCGSAAKPGQALFAYTDRPGEGEKYVYTRRTIFRLYVLDEDESLTSTCPDSYFIAFDKQNYTGFRMGPGSLKDNKDKTWTDSTAAKKIYTIDRLVCMDSIPGTTKYQTDLMQVPSLTSEITTHKTKDTTYFYVGKQNVYRNAGSSILLDRTGTAVSQFKKLSTLPIDGLPGKIAPEGAYGRMVVDTTSTAQNLDVAFRPAGYFLRTSSGRNIRMKQTGEYEWICEEMWHITATYAALQIKATMFSGAEYSETDEGIDIPGWSTMVTGTSVPVVGGGDISGMDGWARIHTNDSRANGYMEFVPANGTRHIHYDNNGLLGTQIPDQYPMFGETSVTVEPDRLVGGFNFTGWTTNADGTGTTYQPGDVINLSEGELTLYAQGTYTGTYHVAFSFLQDGQRYFLTHPGSSAPRYARARAITDWTDTYQGMANAENMEPNYINTFKLLTGPDPCTECAAGEVVLEPRREMRYGAVDSLLFYKNFAPADGEYIGLYYIDPNTIVANTTWAGLFTSTEGWPNYSTATVQNTKLASTHYLGRNIGGNIERYERTNSSAPWIKYNVADNQFDGEALEANATEFQISRVRVADEHYVVIPDTTEEWTSEITFGYHNGEQSEERVWSKLIGKQLMAMTTVGDETVYFHPNPDKIITDATQMRLSANYRLEETFEYIRDTRVVTDVAEADKPSMNDQLEKNYFGRLITSGMSSPMNVQDAGDNYIDIVDTLRITLRPSGTGKIKAYYGRWKEGSAGLHVKPDGTRYRDILVTTKTYHYGETITHLVLKPEHDDYTFNPFAGTSNTINFTLWKVTGRQLLDADDNPIGEEEIIDSEDVTSSAGLALSPGMCSFSRGAAYFAVNNGQTVNQHVTVYTLNENSSQGENLDTLIISTTMTIDAVSYPVTARVPLLQTTTFFDELIWSAEANGTRYYIMANESGLIFHEYTWKNNVLYKKNTSTQLKVGVASSTTDEYITPWKFTYEAGHLDQLTLRTEFGVNKYFGIEGTTGVARDANPSILTYCYDTIYRNSSNNEEEMIRLKYGPGPAKWLKFQVVAGVPSIVLQEDSASATVFSWGYMDREYYLRDNGDYPSAEYAEFFYNREVSTQIQTRYKGYRRFSMLIGNKLTYLCREDESDILDLINDEGDWLTDFDITHIRDARLFEGGSRLSGLSISLDTATLKTTVTATGASPLDVKYGGKYVNIVDTLDVQISLQHNAPEYRFSDGWSSYRSVDDAHLKIPLIRRTYHVAQYDSLICVVDGEEYNHAFPAQPKTGVDDTYTFTLSTQNHTGSHVLNVDNESVALIDPHREDVTISGGMDLSSTTLAEVRLVDEYGNTPSWCEITGKTATTITVKALEEGIRSPRLAYIYLAYIVTIEGKTRFVSDRLTVSQVSLFHYDNHQTLEHTRGASGDERMENGMQQVHETRRILYYYNPSNINHSPDQNVELPVRERAFYGWWRWYRESDDPTIGDTDIPDSLWVQPPRNVGKFNFAYRVIGDSVWNDESDHSKGKKLVTMGRYTVFHYPSKDYNNKQDPPAKNPMVCPPVDKAVVTYAVDISNYYDNLPLSMKTINNVDTTKLDTMTTIYEPTLSLREVFELHPWTEMAAKMENYKSHDDATFPLANERYMEDHVMMAPTGNRLLLNTEQRYRYENLKKNGYSESLLGYYMRDDNWDSMSDEADEDGISRQDTMIWCGGWDADCEWYTYNPSTQTYTKSNHPVMEETDFLQVPARSNITQGQEFDTVYYCLRARSKKSLPAGPDPDEPEDGEYWFNICRYTLIYHNPNKYGPKQENRGVALITNDEIETKYEVLERLNFDYNKPGGEYTLYPHPLPWSDASYGFTYPVSSSLPVNRYHDQQDFPNHGEYGIINRIPYSQYWRKMEQHGGAENGYMIYCDGMASAGQVAALSLSTNLCAGQKMFFSGYVGNPSSQTGKSDPNFIISVQGSEDGVNWDDITSYITGDIKPSNNWYQIYFPIVQTSESKTYVHFRVRVYNVAANFDGNDFVIDDMCIFATKPPVIAYQANTTCKEYGKEDADTHILLRVDYQGIVGEGYNDTKVYYTIKQEVDEGYPIFIEMKDHYLEEEIHTHTGEENDTICGKFYIPSREYVPTDPDSIFDNMNQLIAKFSETSEVFKVGYIVEHLEGGDRPVKYVVHRARMDTKKDYTVHMSGNYTQMLSSICGMTSPLKISNRMVLALDGDEQPETSQLGLCANSTYDLSLHVKGSVYQDHASPIDVNGSCYNDWLLYGDTAEVSSLARYGFKYSDIVKVVRDILRCEPIGTKNTNQFAPNFASINKNELVRIQAAAGVELTEGVDAYALLDSLVSKGFLILYKSNMTTSVISGDSVQYVILPILGTGTDGEKGVEVCTNPIFIKLKPENEAAIPLMVGGLHRDPTEMSQPVVVLATQAVANSEFKLRVDSIRPLVGIYSIDLRSTDDPTFREGVHTLGLTPALNYPNESYYVKCDSILLRPSKLTNFRMRAGYNYTFNIVMQTYSGALKDPSGCEVGTVPFTLSIVPDYLRWAPKNPADNRWNNAENWIGITRDNVVIHDEAFFAPLSGTHVLIPAMEEGMPYPELPQMPLAWKDSVQKVNFSYNACDTIHFLAGAAIGQQQRIGYGHAIVDMSTPHTKWALRSAPITGMLSGDIFMANADLNKETSLWEVGEFDADGRSHTTGNASFWLSLYNKETIHKGNNSNVKDTTYTAAAEWSKVTNALTLSLPIAQGWAVYTNTESKKAAEVRLPKNDDIYYYYYASGDKAYDMYEQNLRTMRNNLAKDQTGGKAGELAFHPDGSSQNYTLTNEAASDLFVFGNPTMGYIDIWGFIADNSLREEFDYIDKDGKYTTISKETAEYRPLSPNAISNSQRFLPPLHAIVVKTSSSAETKVVTLNTNRVVTDTSQVVRPLAAPAMKRNKSQKVTGIMTVTAVNPVSPRCISRLLLGQGYHNEVREGEDAMLTTVNINNFSMTSAPATPFNIYALENGQGLSIDLRDSIVNVPVSFYMSALPYDPVSLLWFTGVNTIDGPLVLFDALTGTEQPIVDGICIAIETPTQNHESRYFIRRPGYDPDKPTDPDNPIATGVGNYDTNEQAIKIIYNGQVYVLRNGHVYTMLGQKVR